MKRSAEETAEILSDIYNEQFGDDQFEPYRLDLAELRVLAGNCKLTSGFINEINKELEERNQALIPFEMFLLLAAQDDFSLTRALPGRVLDKW